MNMHIDEQNACKDIVQRMLKVRSYLNEKDYPAFCDIPAWYDFLKDIKTIQGNFNNDISFLATMLAKQYLEQNYGLGNFNAAEKAQVAPGLDIDVRLSDGRRLVAEIKTTYPYKPNDLGAQQINTFKKDFAKLFQAKADIKLFLLTERKTFELMKHAKYRSQLQNVQIVLLPTGEEFLA